MLLIVLLITLVPVRGDEEAVFDRCNAPLEKKPCRAFYKRYTYDSLIGKCIQLSVGLCGRTGNDFSTEEQCESATAVCKTRAPQDICNIPIEEGPCSDLIKRYGYDSETGKCTDFYYGGCGGNANNFEKEADCERAAMTCPDELGSDICHMTFEMGNCEDYDERYGYDSQLGTCKTYLYSGCGGNANNFLTLEECENATRKCVDEGRSSAGSEAVRPSRWQPGGKPSSGSA
nr:unnamed protein product [Spirometra erinaceieuropaei]